MPSVGSDLIASERLQHTASQTHSLPLNPVGSDLIASERLQPGRDMRWPPSGKGVGYDLIASERLQLDSCVFLLWSCFWSGKRPHRVGAITTSGSVLSPRVERSEWEATSSRRSDYNMGVGNGVCKSNAKVGSDLIASERLQPP